MTLTKTEKLLKALYTGKEITSEQITNKFGVANPSALIHQLRTEGLTIYTNPKRDRDGYRYYAYRMSA